MKRVRVMESGGSRALKKHMTIYFWITVLTIFQMLLIPIGLFLLLFVVSQLYILKRREAPWVPTRKHSVRALLSLANVRPGETILDLGCGDGSILFVGAREFGARGIGYDINPIILFVGWIRNLFGGVLFRVQLLRGDIFKIKIPQADVVTLYLFEHVNSKLLPRLREALPKGTRVVTRAFPIKELTPKRTIVFNKETLYLYEL